MGGLICLGLYLTGYSRLVPGWALGVAASMSNCLLLGYQLKKSVALPAEKAIAYIQAGWFVRLSVVAALLAVSVHVAQIHFLAALAGFFVFYVVAIANAVMAYANTVMNKKQERTERGE